MLSATHRAVEEGDIAAYMYQLLSKQLTQNILVTYTWNSCMCPTVISVKRLDLHQTADKFNLSAIT